MNALLLICQFLPLVGMALIFCFGRSEQRIAKLSGAITYTLDLSILSLLGLWASTGFAPHEFKWFMLYEHGHYQLPIVFYLDSIGAVYLFVIGFIFSIIVRYCRYYLHRESGYKRFFMTIFAFGLGLNMVILAGSIDMLFAGWEIVGIASFLLIAFYRERIQPVRNALRAYTVYRFCDIGLLLGAWLSHLFLHDSDHFSQLSELFARADTAPASYSALILLSLMIVTAASGKSAQFPFCFWLPRAMEWPTPSSAIFYGALSVHLGVFLLLRTMPIWSYYALSRSVIIFIGLITFAIASLSERIQANIKGKVAYASIAQVGLMFVELGAGLGWLVLIHFASNAFLRCYQLLVSPSIVAHKLRIAGSMDILDTQPPTRKKQAYLPESLRHTLPEVLKNSVYVFALQEGNLELLIRWGLWNPLKRMGGRLNKVNRYLKTGFFLSVLGLFFVPFLESLPPVAYLSAPLLALAMVMASLSAFSQKQGFIQVWNAVGMSSTLAAGAVWALYPHIGDDLALFAAGLLPSWLLGVLILRYLLNHETPNLSPFMYRASAQTHPKASLWLFFSFLGLVGFPITPAFVGSDLLLYHASSQHGWLAGLIAVCFVINGISLARVFLRVCMGRPSEVLDEVC